MFVTAWNELMAQTIVNSFQKSGVSSESQEVAMAEHDNPFHGLQEEIDNLRSVWSNFIAENINAVSGTNVDEGVAAVKTAPTIAKIVEGMLEMEDFNDDYNSVEV